MSLISLKEVSKNYLNKTFNLEIKKHEQLIIVGKNGSGKSTLVKLITKYIKPSKGLINSKITKISYLEEKIALPEELIVKDYLNVLEGLKKAETNYELISDFKIPINMRIKYLSKGNKQKLAIIAAFTGFSELIILDEPLNGLDEEAIKIFIDYIKKYQKTLIIITHYLERYKHLNLRVVEL